MWPFTKNITVEVSESPKATIHVVTKNYDGMKQFFIDLGLRVDEKDSGLQFTPFFNEGRGTAIFLEAMTICLEEATDTEPSGALYFDVGDMTSERLDSIKAKYKVHKKRGFFTKNDTYFITPPDGGCLLAEKME